MSKKQERGIIKMENMLVKLIGYTATVLHGDTAVFDRWLWLRKNIQSGNLRTLDAGCGSGAFTIYAAKLGNEAVGVSFNEQNNKKGELRAKILNISNVKFMQGDLRKLDEMSKDLGKFDQIICFETIEHILNDKKLIKDFYSLLNSGGKLLLTTPYKYYKHLYGDQIEMAVCENGDHVRRGYTFEELRNLLREVGFKMELEEFITGFISQQLINLIRIIGDIGPGFGKIAWVITFPLRILVIFDTPLTKLINYPFFSVAIIANKK